MKEEIEYVVSKEITPDKPEKILDLGDNLRKIMYAAYTKIENPNINETNSMKAKAGNRWECLITWYCNLCLIGTRSVVIKKSKKIIPSPFLDAVTLDYGDTTEDSEADLVSITFPDNEEFTKHIPKLLSLKEHEKLVNKHFKEFEMGIISCKTPWNDFSIMPQHWDLIYFLAINHPDVLRSKKMMIGINEFSITQLKDFFYTFVALPSQQPEELHAKKLEVVRLRTLSGGNFWGLETNSFAKSMKEIFPRIFSSSIGTREQHIKNLEKELPKLSTDYNYFKIP